MNETSSSEKPEEESKPKYNFEVMKEIEPTMVRLVEQLRGSIDSGEYDCIISDETGARVPSLILRKIMKEKSPNAEIKTFFLSAGSGLEGQAKRYLPTRAEKKRTGDCKRLSDYLKKAKTDKKILVVTEFLQTGSSARNIGQALKSLGMENFDFAALYLTATDYPDNLYVIEQNKLGKKLFFGSDQEFDPSFGTKHRDLDGVAKAYHYSPYPTTMVKDIRELRKMADKTLTIEEENKIKENIRLSREDVNLLAERVIEQVWGKEEK